MYDILCTYPLRSDLFTLSIHPTSPLVAVGLASGHVQLNQLPPSAGEANGSPTKRSANPSLNGHATISTQWETRRHKGSCRALAFSPDGAHLFSTGSDGLVKIANIETGQVVAKIAIPLDENSVDAPTCLEQLNKQTLALATDSRALHLFDIREGDAAKCQSAKPSKTWENVHADFVTSISTLPTASGGESRQFLTTGAGTVAIIDTRKGILLETADSDDQLLASTVCANKVFVGDEHGKLRSWNVCEWDKDVALNVERGNGSSIDILAAAEGDEGEGGILGIAREDGSLRLADVSSGKVKNRIKVRDECLKHDELDGIAGVGWTCDGRLVTGGGSTVKIWETRDPRHLDGDDQDDASDVDGLASDDEGSSQQDDPDSSDEERPKRKRRKRNRKGVAKQTNGILGFTGL